VFVTAGVNAWKRLVLGADDEIGSVVLLSITAA
jgi:hypothetical protein